MTRFWPLGGATLIATSPCPIFLGLPLTAGASAFFILSQSRGAAGMVRRPFSSSVRRMQTVHKIRTRGAQHFFDLLDRLPNHAARLAGLNLALQLKEPPIGAVETLCQYGCHAKERDRVYPKYGGRIGDMKLRGFKRTYIGRVRLIQQHGEFAEHGARLRHPGDLNAFLYDRDRALLKDQQSAGCRGGAEHGLTGLVSGERKGGEPPLENCHIGNQGRRHVRSSVVLAGRHSKTNGSLSIFVGSHGAMNPAGRVCCNMRTEYSWLNHNCNCTRLKFAFLLRSYDRPASRRGPPRPVGGPPLLGGVGGIAAIAAHPFLSWASAKRVHGLRSSQNI